MMPADERGYAAAADLADAGDKDDEDDGEGADAGGEGPTRAERKARKAFLKLGLEEQKGFSRVTVRKGKDMHFVVNSPAVFRMPGTDYWIVFGAPAVDDYGSRQAAASKGLAGMGAPGMPAGGLEAALSGAGGALAASRTAEAKPAAAAASAAAADEGADEELPEGIESKDVEFVMSHTGATRSVAIAALKEHKEVVPAIMAIGN